MSDLNITLDQMAETALPRKIRELIQDLKAADWRQVSGRKGVAPEI
jgi:hypothetical protein